MRTNTTWWPIPHEDHYHMMTNTTWWPIPHDDQCHMRTNTTWGPIPHEDQYHIWTSTTYGLYHIWTNTTCGPIPHDDQYHMRTNTTWGPIPREDQHRLRTKPPDVLPPCLLSGWTDGRILHHQCKERTCIRFSRLPPGFIHRNIVEFDPLLEWPIWCPLKTCVTVCSFVTSYVGVGVLY